MQRHVLPPFEAALKAAQEPLHYQECGLDDVWLTNGFTVLETPFGLSVHIEDEKGLLAALAGAICDDKASLGSKELRFLRKTLGLSQAGLAQLLGCTDQTVARWEKNQNHIDAAAERIVRLLVKAKLCGDGDVTAQLRALAELDERIHGRKVLRHGHEGWRRAVA